MSLSGDKGVAQFKKSVKMGHPSDYLRFVEHSSPTQKAVFLEPSISSFCRSNNWVKKGFTQKLPFKMKPAPHDVHFEEVTD